MLRKQFSDCRPIHPNKICVLPLISTRLPSGSEFMHLPGSSSIGGLRGSRRLAHGIVSAFDWDVGETPIEDQRAGDIVSALRR